MARPKRRPSSRCPARPRSGPHAALLAGPGAAAPEVKEPVLEMDEIQGNGLVGFNKDHQTYLFLAFQRTPAARGAVREWVRALSPFVASANDVYAFNQLFRTLRRRHGQDPRGLVATWVNVAFSFPALRDLVSAEEAESFSDGAFRDGLAANADDLGDPTDEAAEGHPSHWVVGGPGNEADVVVMVASDDPNLLSGEVRRIEDGIYNGTASDGTRLSQVLRVIFKQHGSTLPGTLTGHEHFGFKDGISQPGVRGMASGLHEGEPITPRYVDPADATQQDPASPEFARPGQPLVWPGEFVFGYPEQNHNDRRAPGPIASACPRWARNGSYVVVRRLRQDVAGFREFLTRTAAALAGKPGFAGMTPRRLGALLVGRWPSGAPVIRAALQDAPDLARDAFAVNHFTYKVPAPAMRLVAEAGYPADEVAGADADPFGGVCPYAAHIRKVNPRDTDTEQGAPDTLTRSILRRGIPFGAPLEEGLGPQDDPVKGDRGLLFVSYQTSIEDQFVFLNQTWAGSPTLPSGGGGPDVVIGQVTGDDGRRVRFVDLPGSDGSVETIEVPAEFVIATGGGYFFAPSLGALCYVLGGTDEEKARFVASLPADT